MHEKADLINRFLAKFIDLLIAGGLSQTFRFFGPLAALTYLLISDGFFDGKSIGKKLIGIKTILKSNKRPCDFKYSILRNLPIGIVALFAFTPFIGWLLFFTLGLLIIGFEIYLIVSDKEGLRIGDIIADTMVVDEPREDVEPTSDDSI